MTQAEAGKGSDQRPGKGYQAKYDLIDWPSRRASAPDIDEPRPKCGDCSGGKLPSGQPCPACVPTDDGPD